MSTPRDVERLLDMLALSRRIATRLAGVSRAEFDEDEDLLVVLVHLIQTIGEAARSVSDDTRNLGRKRE